MQSQDGKGLGLDDLSLLFMHLTSVLSAIFHLSFFEGLNAAGSFYCFAIREFTVFFVGRVSRALVKGCPTHKNGTSASLRPLREDLPPKNGCRPRPPSRALRLCASLLVNLPFSYPSQTKTNSPPAPPPSARRMVQSGQSGKIPRGGGENEGERPSCFSPLRRSWNPQTRSGVRS
jgi:hypothetical protein